MKSIYLDKSCLNVSIILYFRFGEEIKYIIKKELRDKIPDMEGFYRLELAKGSFI